MHMPCFYTHIQAHIEKENFPTLFHTPFSLVFVVVVVVVHVATKCWHTFWTNEWTGWLCNATTSSYFFRFLFPSKSVLLHTFIFSQHIGTLFGNFQQPTAYAQRWCNCVAGFGDFDDKQKRNLGANLLSFYVCSLRKVANFVAQQNCFH